MTTEPRQPCKGMGPPGWRCACGEAFDDYYGLAEHRRLAWNCPRCEVAPSATLAAHELYSWQCGHWIRRDDLGATLRDPGPLPTHYPTFGASVGHLACACGHYSVTLSSTYDAAIALVNEHIRGLPA